VNWNSPEAVPARSYCREPVTSLLSRLVMVNVPLLKVTVLETAAVPMVQVQALAPCVAVASPTVVEVAAWAAAARVVTVSVVTVGGPGRGRRATRRGAECGDG
jgi:hypothetical protein